MTFTSGDVNFSPGIPAGGTSYFSLENVLGAGSIVITFPILLSKTFDPSKVVVNGVSTLTLTFQNANAAAATNIAVTDSLPAHLVVASPPSRSSTCTGATFTGTSAGSATIGITIPSLAAGATCSVKINVIASAAGSYDNVTSKVTSNGLPDGAPAEATLLVVMPPFLIRYSSNLTAGDSVVNITNTGANGNSLFGPGFGDPAGNICVNVYAFSPDEQLISCCSCLVTPNGSCT